MRLLDGCGRLKGPHDVVVETSDGRVVELDADAIVVCTGSRPRIPEFAAPDGERVLTTRDAYPPPQLPSHLCIVGSGVTGVEFTHMFSSFGCEVTLVVSRQQVLPSKDAEVAAALEDDFLARGVHLLKGARASDICRVGDGVVVECTDGRKVSASHAAVHRRRAELGRARPRRRRGRRRRRRVRADQPPRPDQREAHLRRR